MTFIVLIRTIKNGSVEKGSQGNMVKAMQYMLVKLKYAVLISSCYQIGLHS